MRAWQWVLENRALLGKAATFVGGLLAAGHAAAVHGFGSDWTMTAAFVFGYVGTALWTAGATKSDQYHRDKAQQEAGQ